MHWKSDARRQSETLSINTEYAGIWNRRGWNRRCAGTLLVAAIIAPLRRFDT